MCHQHRTLECQQDNIWRINHIQCHIRWRTLQTVRLYFSMLRISDVQLILERLGSPVTLLKKSVLIGCTEQNQVQFCLDVGEDILMQNTDSILQVCTDHKLCSDVLVCIWWCRTAGSGSSGGSVWWKVHWSKEKFLCSKAIRGSFTGQGSQLNVILSELVFSKPSDVSWFSTAHQQV